MSKTLPENLVPRRYQEEVFERAQKGHFKFKSPLKVAMMRYLQEMLSLH